MDFVNLFYSFCELWGKIGSSDISVTKVWLNHNKLNMKSKNWGYQWFCPVVKVHWSHINFTLKTKLKKTGGQSFEKDKLFILH